MCGLPSSLAHVRDLRGVRLCPLHGDRTGPPQRRRHARSGVAGGGGSEGRDVSTAGHGDHRSRTSAALLSTERDPVYGCELVTSRLDAEGYAYHGRSRAHLVAWIAEHGELGKTPTGERLELDHLCRRRHCIALHHLEPVTRSENERRKRWAYRVGRAMCQHGHDLATTRIVTPEGGVVCRQCNLDATR